MTNDKIVAKLHKTFASIRAAQSRGLTMNSRRLQELVDRYNDLLDLLIKAGEYYGKWEAYCRDIGADRTHNAYDLIA